MIVRFHPFSGVSTDGQPRSVPLPVGSTVAATRFTTLSHAGASPRAALTGSFQLALWVCGAIGVAAVAVTFLLIRRDKHAVGAASPGTADSLSSPPVLVPSD